MRASLLPTQKSGPTDAPDPDLRERGSVISRLEHLSEIAESEHSGMTSFGQSKDLNDWNGRVYSLDREVVECRSPMRTNCD